MTTRANLTQLLAMAIGAGLSTAAFGAIAQQAPPSIRHNLGDVASIATPIDATFLKPEATAVDFQIYSVVLSGQTILSLYLGNAPAFPFDNSKQLRIGKCLALSTTTSLQDEESRDVLLGMENAQRFPTRLHMFYRRLNTQTARQADEIIASVRFLKGQDCLVDGSEK